MADLGVFFCPPEQRIYCYFTYMYIGVFCNQAVSVVTLHTVPLGLGTLAFNVLHTCLQNNTLKRLMSRPIA